MGPPIRKSDMTGISLCSPSEDGRLLGKHMSKKNLSFFTDSPKLISDAESLSTEDRKEVQSRSLIRNQKRVTPRQSWSFEGISRAAIMEVTALKDFFVNFLGLVSLVPIDDPNRAANLGRIG